MKKTACLCLWIAGSALFAQNISLRLGLYDNPPMTFIQDKVPAGFIVDVISDFARRQQIDLRFVAAPFHELFEKLKRGEIDVIAPIAFSEERSQFLRFNSESVLIDWSNFIMSEAGNFKLLSDLDGQKIGVVKSDYYAKLLEKDLLLQRIICRFSEYDDFLQIVSAVAANKISAGFIGRFSLSYILKSHQEISGIRVMPGSFYHEPLFFGINPQKAYLVEMLDAYLRDAKRSKSSPLNQSYERWFGQTRYQKRLIFFSENYLWILLAVALTIAIFIFFNLILRSKVSRSVHEINRQKSYFENLFKMIPAGIVILDDKNRVTDINQEFQSTFGFTLDEIRGRELASLINSEDTLPQALSLIGQARSGERVFADGKRRTKSGKMMDFHIIASPIIVEGKVLGSTAIYLDITEKKRMEEEIIKSKNIESVGVLAGGIAHDFNNMLTGILGNLSVAKRMIGNAQASSILEKAEKATLKASGLTQKLLTFSKGGFPIKKVVYLPDLVRDSLDLVISGSNVHAELKVGDHIPTCEIDVTQILQVINNLLINAREAMPAGGKVEIGVQSHLQQKNDNILEKGKYVSLTVKDHGQGIPAGSLQRIFIPYFTTKKTGTGLGLAIAYSIVNKHHGRITVHSPKGQGAIFTVFLPASDKSVAGSSGPPAAAIKQARILLMDDEEIIRDVFMDMLRPTPYRIDLAASSREALEKFQAARQVNDPYDLVFLDLTGPGDIGGIKTLEKILTIDPLAIAIAISGYSVSEVFSEPDRFHFSDFLPKPFQSEDLLNIISKNLRTDR
jgi:PAS domain S-box-containing protein